MKICCAYCGENNAEFASIKEIDDQFTKIAVLCNSCGKEDHPHIRTVILLVGLGIANANDDLIKNKLRLLIGLD